MSAALRGASTRIEGAADRRKQPSLRHSRGERPIPVIERSAEAKYRETNLAFVQLRKSLTGGPNAGVTLKGRSRESKAVSGFCDRAPLILINERAGIP